MDARTDVFALGVVLYEMATGTRPFQGETPTALVDSILHKTPPSPETLNPEVPPGLARVIDRCLAKQPEDRYASTHDLAKDLAMLRDRLAQPQVVTTPAGKSTLPVPRTPLVGRGAELAAVRLDSTLRQRAACRAGWRPGSRRTSSA